MISKEELKKIALLKGIGSMGNAEKDYLLEIALLLISRSTKDELVFKGGTCLSKFYKIDRFSEDIDFTARREINWDLILQRVISGFSSFGIPAEVKSSEKKHSSLMVKMRFKGPLYTGLPQSLSGINIDINLKSSIDTEPVAAKYSPLYPEIPGFSLLVMQEKEILAEKVRAVMSREKARDVYDLWFLLGKGVPFDRKLAQKKLDFYNEEWSAEKFAAGIENKKPIWETELRELITNVPDFNDVKKAVLEKVRF
jgi:hypothetical protein